MARPVSAYQLGPKARYRIMEGFATVVEVFPGLGVSGYRCYGREMQYIAPLERVSILVGPNNSGKSTGLALFHQHLASLHAVAAARGGVGIDASWLRSVLGEPPMPFRLAWPVREDASEAPVVRNLLHTMARAGGLPWVRVQVDVNAGSSGLDPEFVAEMARMLSRDQWSQLSLQLTNSSGGHETADVERVLEHLRRNRLHDPPSSQFVPAHREIRLGNSGAAWNFGGSGLIEQLDRLKNHEADETHLAEQYDRLVESTRDVLELDAFDYHVARNSNTLIFRINGQQRAISALGTGYEHIFIVVAATVAFPDSLVCAEEPEVHMHPRLQRRLARYLRDETTNQVILTTHSATLIDSLSAATFRLQQSEAVTTVDSPIAGQTLQLLDELGYHAADILQTNCAIWVEGPSDRIYLRDWIRRFSEHEYDDELLEGVHFSIMFYGGALLAHVTAADEPTSEQVALPRLNQHFAVVADSDRNGPSAPLKPRLERIRTEIDSQSPFGLLWITEGRTIEHYIEPEILKHAVDAVHPNNTEYQPPADQWQDALSMKGAGGAIGRVDKVELAQFVVSDSQPSFERLHLGSQLASLVDLIRRANRA